ncbi:MAG: hypothetical protein K6G22_09485 [Lachnospiraceae bacterium]|nr:hypothetical protein [Lachnospiraceae bacterium]
MKFRTSIILIGLLEGLLLAGCSGGKEPVPDNTAGLYQIEYRPGYGDMAGAYHYERLSKDDKGEWIIESYDRDIFSDPIEITTYAVSQEAVNEFAAFLSEKDVISLSTRKESKDFVTDYTPFSISIWYEKKPGEKNWDSYQIEEYRVYSDDDYALLKEFTEKFHSLRGRKLSVRQQEN